jgi:hypothetical protein
MATVRYGILWAAGVALFLQPQIALAGMPAVTLTDFARTRAQTASFFLVVILLSAWAVRGLWNSLAGDFARLPRLTYGRSLAVVVLWGLLFVIVLTMISGARELMTPGAWEKQGLTYRLLGTTEATPTAASDNPSSSNELAAERRTALRNLYTELLKRAVGNDGAFPSTLQKDAGTSQANMPRASAWNMSTCRGNASAGRHGFSRTSRTCLTAVATRSLPTARSGPPRRPTFVRFLLKSRGDEKESRRCDWRICRVGNRAFLRGAGLSH